MDGIYPAMLKEGMEHLERPLRNIFRGCLALGYVPSSWQQVKVVFIPKPGKDDYSNPKNEEQTHRTFHIGKHFDFH